MKILTGVLAPWGKCYITLLGSLGDTNNFDPARRKKVTLIAVSVIIVSLFSLFFTMYEGAPKINHAPFIGLGEVLADETAKAIDNHGTVIPVLANYHTTGSTPLTDEWKTFAKEIKKHSGVTLANPVIVKLDETTGEPALARADFDNLVEKNSAAGAVVFFVGLPLWDPANPLTLPSGKAPKIIAVHNTPLPFKKYFTGSVATLLITSRQSPDEKAAGEPKTTRQWFDKYFQVFTAENYQSSPD